MNPDLKVNSNIGTSFINMRSVATVATTLLASLSSNSYANHEREDINTDMIKCEYINTESTLQDRNCIFIPRKSFRNIYKKIAKSEWFSEAYTNMSVGDVLLIED